MHTALYTVSLCVNILSPWHPDQDGTGSNYFSIPDLLPHSPPPPPPPSARKFSIKCARRLGSLTTQKVPFRKQFGDPEGPASSLRAWSAGIPFLRHDDDLGVRHKPKPRLTL